MDALIDGLDLDRVDILEAVRCAQQPVDSRFHSFRASSSSSLFGWLLTLFTVSYRILLQQLPSMPDQQRVGSLFEALAKHYLRSNPALQGTLYANSGASPSPAHSLHSYCFFCF